MPNDQFGRPVKVGDPVTLKGKVTKVTEEPNYINCTVQLDIPMPPAGTEVSINLNTAQLEDDAPAASPKASDAKANDAKKPPFESKPLQQEQSHQAHAQQQQESKQRESKK